MRVLNTSERLGLNPKAQGEFLIQRHKDTENDYETLRSLRLCGSILVFLGQVLRLAEPLLVERVINAFFQNRQQGAVNQFAVGAAGG